MAGQAFNMESTCSATKVLSMFAHNDQRKPNEPCDGVEGEIGEEGAAH